MTLATAEYLKAPLKVPLSSIAYAVIVPSSLSVRSVTLSGLDENTMEIATSSPFLGKSGETNTSENEENAFST